MKYRLFRQRVLVRVKNLVKYLVAKLPKKWRSKVTASLLIYWWKITTLANKSSSSNSQIFREVSREINSSFEQEFVLEFLSDVYFEGNSKGIDRSQWGHSDVTFDKRIGIIIFPGQSICLRKPILLNQSWLRVKLAPAFHDNSNINISIAIDFVCENMAPFRIGSLNVHSNLTAGEWSGCELDLRAFNDLVGIFQVTYISGPETKVNRSPVILSKLTIGRKSELDLLEARSFRELRTKNEIGHFNDVYDHEMYNTSEYKTEELVIRELPKKLKLFDTGQKIQLSDLVPLANESVYSYAMRLLDSGTTQVIPEFSARINEVLLGQDQLNILSICSGAARIESGLDRDSTRPVKWTLQDLNLELLKKARRKFPSTSKIDFLIGDVNELSDSGEKWDIIVCVSGLHHVVELEQVIKFISDALSNNGEFWLIGEYVGRSGNRLWPDALIAADKAFGSLPSKYRMNSHTKEVDYRVPRNDYSIDCFEGVRAQEIENIISRYFLPVSIDRRNNFLWRLINLAYADNYDLTNVEDRRLISSLVSAELEFYNLTRDGTELNAIYRKL